MKKITLLLFVTLLTMLAVAQVDSKYLITSKGVDVFKIWGKMPVKVYGYEIRKISGDAYSHNATYNVSKNEQKILQIVELRGGMIEAVNILSDDFKTSKGIGVGSTLEEFLAVYPDFSMDNDYEGLIYGINTEQLPNIIFELYESDFISKEKLKQLDSVALVPSDFKKGARIKKVLIFGIYD